MSQKNRNKKTKLLINRVPIDWDSNQSYYFFNPKHPLAHELKKKAEEVPLLKSHIYLCSSSASKICLLSKKALLASARLSNENLKASSEDRWLISLPFYHVSGISILARAFLSKSPFWILDSSWNPKSFQQNIEKNKISLSSLVPTQVYDLVKNNLSSPASLRALLVGGDFLSPSLYKKARALGWPVLTCYGATETSSHIASATLDSLKKTSFPEMKLLKGVEIKECQNKKHAFYRVKTEGLLTAYFDFKSQKLYDPKDEQGFFSLEDRLFLKKRVLSVSKEESQRIQILGEKVELSSLRDKLEKAMEKTMKKTSSAFLNIILLPVPEERQKWKLVLVAEIKDFERVFAVLQAYNKEVLAYEKIGAIYFLEQAPSQLFLKVKDAILRKKLGF